MTRTDAVAPHPAAQHAAPGPPGTTTITARALRHLAVCLVREATHVPHRDIVVGLTDLGGALKVSVTVPVDLGPGGGTVAERGSGLRRRVITGMQDLAGRTVEIVDVRYAGVRRAERRRVR